jgi:hypothetical protein
MSEQSATQPSLSPEEIRRQLPESNHQEMKALIESGAYGLKFSPDTDQVPSELECLQYVWGVEANGVDFFRFVNSPAASQVPKPIFGSLAYYFEEEETNLGTFSNPRHIGIVTDHGTIVAKWGAFGVVEHPPEVYPAGYGEVEYWTMPFTIETAQGPQMFYLLPKAKFPVQEDANFEVQITDGTQVQATLVGILRRQKTGHGRQRQFDILHVSNQSQTPQLVELAIDKLSKAQLFDEVKVD